MHLSFPPNTLSESSQLVPASAFAPGVVALEKNAGTSANALCEAFRAQIAEGKPSALALGLARPQIVCAAEEEVSGLAIFADKDSGALEAWRNAFGSGQILFRFVFLAEPAEQIEEDAFECDLPVAQHFTEPRALVSRTTGKKSATLFRRIEKLGARELWSAETSFPRFHQIRLHAFECALPIVGDALYGGVPAVNVSELRPKKRLNKGEDKPFYAPICLHLSRISVAAGVPTIASVGLDAPLPGGFDALLAKLRNLPQNQKNAGK